MRTITLMDKETVKNGGQYPYRFENVVYFGIDTNDMYIIVSGDNVHRIPVDTISEVFERIE